MVKDKDVRAGDVPFFNHNDVSRSDAEKIQSWFRFLVRSVSVEKFSMLLVSVLFKEHIDLKHDFWGLTKTSVFQLWMKNNDEILDGE
jgi:hypothetical protein